MKATTWDMVCAANQHLDIIGARFTLVQFFPGRYQAIAVDDKGTAWANRKIGSPMNEEQTRQFVKTVVFKHQQPSSVPFQRQ